ncbi:MAG: Hpt domain-containing protein, partial [Lachnospiraceae bacterium]|nr:Hpt domain-containing protein [Lachnospiraceae bacterium]
MDVSQYLDIFLDETKEHLQNLNTQILALEQDSENMDTINEIFRAAHSLKGMAGTMGYKRMQTLTHDMENVFSEVRTGNIKVNAQMIDTLFQCLDALEEYLSIIQESADEGDNDNEPLIKELNRILNDKGGEEKKADPQTEEAPAKEAPTLNTHWMNVECRPEDRLQIKEAKEKGKNIYGITVIVQEACLLKAARAFLVFKAIEEIGEVISTQPSAQDIEDEKFELDFSLIVASERQLDEVLDAVKKVSEIADAMGDIYVLEEEPKAEEPETTVPAVAQTTQPEVLNKSETPKAVEKPAVKQPEKKAAAKQQMNRTVRVDIEKLDVLMNLVSELIIAKNSLVSSATGTDQNAGFNEQIEYLESVTTNLHESVMKVRMVPIESVLNKFPRMIRDLSKKLNKQMELYMTGEETELDRTVVDEIGDPLMHLLR